VPTYNTDLIYDVGGVMQARPFTIGRLGHFGLYVRDVEASARFYQDLLGFRHTDSLPAPDGPDPIGLFLTYNTDHHAMVLIDASVGRSRNDRYDRGITINQMSFQVGTLAEVMDANAMLIDEGAPIWRVGRDVPGSNWAVYFTDPDEHTVELFYGMEQIGWNRRSKPLPEFMQYRTAEVPDMPAPAEIDEVARIESAGGNIERGHRWEETRPRTFDVGGVRLARPFKVVNSGPISLFVDELDAARAFYRDRLGMAVTETVNCDGRKIVFMRTGTEHHTIALLERSLRTTLGLAEHTSLAAYGVQVGSYRQLTDALAFLQDEGCHVVELPHEFHTGVDYAFHVTDPDGHCVQLYHEMENVGSAGTPLSPDQRCEIPSVWPPTISPGRTPSPNLTFQGPLG
jgi:catechol 2,3-dioxygenase-like lactoylglutathione lyase family enzyme